MAIKINHELKVESLQGRLEKMFELSGDKIKALEKSWEASRGTPVFTVEGRYTTRGWTEWTQGFQFGSALLQFDATGAKEFLELGRSKTMALMSPHLTHFGVHDHGFNNISTYGNLWRLSRENKFEASPQERKFYELALKVSGAVQAARWTALPENGGYIYSFNGPHSLFIDTVRSLRSLALAHQLGHVLLDERDRRVSLLGRVIEHLLTTARFSIYYGEGRDVYDARGRTAHESIFNIKDGSYRCPNSQQGYSPFTTWTRGLGWAICGFAEQIEYLQFLSEDELREAGDRGETLKLVKRAAAATADYYLDCCCADGVPVWDTGAPGLEKMGAYLDKKSDPCNVFEPVDSSAAAIAAQGLLRLGSGGGSELAKRYFQAGLTIMETLLQEPYLSESPRHQGLLLHSIYHRPNGWDYIREGQKIPNGESSMWGDYHFREAGLMLLKQIRGEPYPTFFNRTYS
jgi:hypothetical protein